MSDEPDKLLNQVDNSEIKGQEVPGKTVMPEQPSTNISQESTEENTGIKEDFPEEYNEAQESETQRYTLQNVNGQSHVDIAPGTNSEKSVSWEASEYILHHKDTGWFVILGSVSVALAVLLYFVVDIWAAIVVIMMSVTIIVYAQRKPEVLNYSLTTEGLSIGNKNYTFSQFKSFNILHDGGVESIEFMPLKRFMPGISIYFDTAHKDQIIDILSLQLPHEDKEPDFVDRIARRLRF